MVETSDTGRRWPRYSDLEGASVLITGGGSGIGAELVDAFLAQGAKVAFIDFVDCQDFVSRMEARHGRAPLWIQADLRDVSAIEAAVARAREAHGPIGKLICNAARDTRTTMGEVDLETWDDLHAINIRHFYFAAQACLEDLKATPGAAIVNFTSNSFMQGTPNLQVYQAAKSAVIGLTRGQARDLGEFGIRVNMVAPGWVMTERQKTLWAKPEPLAKQLDRQAIHREIEPFEMAGPCLFLASESASAVTATCLVADLGGV